MSVVLPRLDCTCVWEMDEPPPIPSIQPSIHPIRIHPDILFIQNHPSSSAPVPVAIRAMFSPGVTARFAIFRRFDLTPTNPPPPPMSCTPGKDQLIAYFPPTPLSIFCCESEAAFRGWTMSCANSEWKWSSSKFCTGSLSETRGDDLLKKIQKIEFLRRNPKFWSRIAQSVP